MSISASWQSENCSGVLLVIATIEPRSDHDEDTAHLAKALKLPRHHVPAEAA